MAQFKVRRDYSINNVPIVGYQDTADAQDVILWAVRQVTETDLSTDSSGILRVNYKPIIDITHDSIIDVNGIPKERKIDDKDITISGYYIGEVDGKNGEIHLYLDAAKTTDAANRGNITITYYTLAPIKIDSEGKIEVVTDINNQTVNANITNSQIHTIIDNSSLDVNIQGQTIKVDDSTPIKTNINQDFVYAGKDSSGIDYNIKYAQGVITKSKNMSALTSSGDYIWASAGSNKICLMKLYLINNMNEPITFDVREGSTMSIINNKAASGKMSLPAYGSIMLDFGAGYKFSTSAAGLKFYAVSPATIDLTAIAVGYEY